MTKLLKDEVVYFSGEGVLFVYFNFIQVLALD